MTDERTGENPVVEESAEATPAEERPQYGVGPFSVREVALVGVWLVAFIVSFFSVSVERVMAQLLFGGSVWTNGLDWILTIGLPTVAVFLIVLRRFSPDGIRRVGSLAIDQFASVAFSVSAVVWLGLLWRNVAVVAETELWVYSWVAWVEFFIMLAGVVLTVVAPLIPPFAEDFAGRREVPAHRNARPIRPVSPRPARPTAPQQSAPSDAETALYGSGAETAVLASAGHTQDDRSGYAAPRAWEPEQTRDTFEPVEAEPAPQSAQQAFWALAPEERDVVDESGIPMFRVGPTAWALVLEDRGEVFIIRHEDGRVGYLHDVSDVTRG